MNIFVAGGGRVGFHIARLLSAEKHDVTVIEADSNQIEHIDYNLDVRTIKGNASDVLLLKTADAGAADLFLAFTGDDEVNLIAATTAKGLGAKQAVARAHNATYIESSILYETIMEIDYVLSPEALTAHEIATYIENPGMVALETFGRGLVQMRQLRVSKSPLASGQTLKDLALPPGVLLGLITRNGHVEIPHGNSTIHPHDVVTLIGHKERMGQLLALFQGVDTHNHKVVVMGGSAIGVQLAQILENHGRAVKLFDWNMAKCKEMAALFKKTKVVCRDATSRLALEQEHVDGADVFVSATRDDERNIMAGVLAKEVGAKQTVCVVHQPDFAPLVTKLGVDHAVTPRACIANRVLRLVSQRTVSSLAVLEEGRVEILEFKIKGDSPALGHRLVDVKFPKDCLVATILRGEEVIVPGGDDEIHAGDSVIVIAAAAAVGAVRRLFS